ncbi:MAG TPA: DUF1648 domain-containing protein [Balneolales bacterium]|nr:DUF1648 domain-containing protein [Balneolales bacterium]
MSIGDNNIAKSKHLAGTLMIMLLFIGTLQIYLYSSMLPQKIATHFNAHGQADGWMSHRAFILYSIGMFYFMGGIFLLSGWVIPKLPTELINIPNRGYWLHPARKEQAVEVLITYLYWIGVSTILFLLILTQMTILANIHQSIISSKIFWTVTGSYIVCIFTLGWKMYRYFKPTH